MSVLATVGNNALAQRTPTLIAAEINSIKEQTRKMVLFNSIEIGRRLKEAKAMIGHGEWGNWLEESVDYSQSTANNLMRIFEEYGSNQIAFFDNNANSQALGNLSYTQAVALLGIPREEREQFVIENKVEDMSTRELQQAIKERDEALKKFENAKKAAEEIAQARDKAQEEASNLRSSERVGKQLLQENKVTIKMLQDALQKEKEHTKAEVDKLVKLLNEARANGASDELVKQMEKELQEARKKVDELTQQIKQPVILEPAVIEKIPEETERELAELRKRNKELEAKVDNASILKFDLYFKDLVNGFKSLLGILAEIKETDPEAHERYRSAVLKLLGKMSEPLGIPLEPVKSEEASFQERLAAQGLRQVNLEETIENSEPGQKEPQDGGQTTWSCCKCGKGIPEFDAVFIPDPGNEDIERAYCSDCAGNCHE